MFNAVLTDTTSGKEVGDACSASGQTETCFIFNGSTVAAGESVSVELDGITNPSTVSFTDTVSVHTSSDLTPVTSASYPIGGPPPAPTVAKISPSSGRSSGGTSVTITRTNLVGATAVSFGANAAAAFKVSNATQITATSPAGSATVDVRVTSSGGTSAISSADRFTFTVPPGPITATGGKSFPGTAPATISGIFATFSDPDTQTPATEYSATIGWGDGSSSSAGTVSGASGNFTVAGSHIYAASGIFTITVTLTDVHNAANTATVTDSAAITGTGPIMSASSPAVQSSSGAAFTGSVDPNGLPTTVHFEYGLDPRYRAAGGAIVYDHSTPDQTVGADFTNHAVSASVSGLVPNALYHERLVATNVDGTTVGPDQTFMTKQDPKPRAPVLGRSVNATPVSGVVFIKPPPGKSVRALGAQFSPAALTKGHGFVPLTEARQLPFGSQVDARQGSLKLITATAQHGKTQQGVFGGGLFQLSQKRSGLSKGLTTLSLLEGDFSGAPTYSVCKAHGAADGAGPAAQAARLSSRILQTLRARDNHGRFRSRGRYSAATVRGTQLDTTDRCDGTITVEHRGTVLVDDFTRQRTVTVHAGHSYLAAAIKLGHKHR